MPDSKKDYESPEIARVGDARELTLGKSSPVADVPGEPSGGYFDSSLTEVVPEPESPGA